MNPSSNHQDQTAARTFRVGASDYTFHVTRGPVVMDVEGQVSGCTLNTVREILIAGTTPEKHRLHVLLRELARAWTFETGEPAITSDWFDLCATVAASAMRELLPAAAWAALETIATSPTAEGGAA